MKLFKNILACIICTITLMTSNAFALDQMAKEETTPPAAEGALTADQIPPFYSSDINNQNPQKN